MSSVLTRSVTICLLLAGASLFLSNARKPETPLARTKLAQFPMTLDGWQAVVDPPLDKDVLRVLGVDDYLSRAYYRDNKAIGLYLGFYESQRQGDTIHSPLNCIPGSGWEPISEGRLDIANVDGKGRNVRINRYLIQKGLDRQLVLYWYHGRGRVVADEYVSRALLVKDAIFTNRTNGSLARVIVPLPVGGQEYVDAAEALGQTFVRTIFPLLDSYLP